MVKKSIRNALKGGPSQGTVSMFPQQKPEPIKKVREFVVVEPTDELSTIIRRNLKTFQEDRLRERLTWGNGDYIPDSLDKTDRLHTFASLARREKMDKDAYRSRILKDIDRQKQTPLLKAFILAVDANVWKWANHVHRVVHTTFFGTEPLRKIVLMPLPQVFPGIEDSVLEYFYAANTALFRNGIANLGLAARKHGIRLIPYAETLPHKQAHLYELLSPMELFTAHAASSNRGILIKSPQPEDLNPRTFIALVDNYEQLKTCIRFNVRCVPNFNILRGNHTKLSQIRDSELYRAWGRECWQGTNPLAYVENSTPSQIAKYSKLVSVLAL